MTNLDHPLTHDGETLAFCCNAATALRLAAALIIVDRVDKPVSVDKIVPVNRPFMVIDGAGCHWCIVYAPSYDSARELANASTGGDFIATDSTDLSVSPADAVNALNNGAFFRGAFLYTAPAYHRAGHSVLNADGRVVAHSPNDANLILAALLAYKP